MCTDDRHHPIDTAAGVHALVAVSLCSTVTRLNATVVDAHLARLDTDARLAFVADLWAARGFETAVEDRVVVARRHGESVTLYPVGSRRLRRTPRPDRPVEVVVAFDAVPAWAVRDEVRVLARSDLREMLRYALDPVDAERLCRTYLGVSPSELTPPLSLRVRTAVDSLHGVEESVGVTTIVAVLAVVVLVVAATGALFADETEPLVGAASLSDSFDESDLLTPEPTAEPSSSAADDTGTDTAPPDVGGLDTVPGVGPDGVTNVTALALAHDRELGDSYTLWTDRYRPENRVPGAPLTQRDTDIAVQGDRYLVEETFETGDDRHLARVIYFDGTDWYVDDRSTETPSIRWVDGATGVVDPDPHALRRTLVERCLSTPTTEVTERFSVGRDTRYRLVGAGRPEGFSTQVYNYSFVAVVGERGLVHEATVEFVIAAGEQGYRYRFEWTYGAFGATTVTEPAWLHLANPPNDPTTESPTDRNESAAPTATATPS